MDQTREKLLNAGVDLVAAGGSEEVTLRRVAGHAQVSVATAYRYFPDRDSLLEGVAAWISSRVTAATAPESADGLADWARIIYEQFEVNNRFVRAQLNTPTGRDIRARWRKRRDEVVLGTVKRSFPRASADAQRRLAGVLRALVNLHAWVSLNDDWGMSGKEAGKLIAWAIATLIKEARKRPAGLEFK
jgi:AcrR family transcriptional regulator